MNNSLGPSDLRGYSFLQVLVSAGIQFCRYLILQVFDSAGIQLCRDSFSAGIRVCRHSSQKVFNSAGIQFCRYSRLQGFRYSRRQKVWSYRYIKQYYPNFQRAVARNFLSFFVEIFRLNLLVEVLTTSRQIFVASKNGKFSGTRSFLRPRGADFGQKCPFSGENRQKRVRARPQKWPCTAEFFIPWGHDNYLWNQK